MTMTSRVLALVASLASVSPAFASGQANPQTNAPVASDAFASACATC